MGHNQLPKQHFHPEVILRQYWIQSWGNTGFYPGFFNKKPRISNMAIQHRTRSGSRMKPVWDTGCSHGSSIYSTYNQDLKIELYMRVKFELLNAILAVTCQSCVIWVVEGELCRFCLVKIFDFLIVFKI